LGALGVGVVKKVALVILIQLAMFAGIVYLLMPEQCECNVTHEVLIATVNNDRILSPPTKGEWRSAEYVAERLIEEFPEVGDRLYLCDSRYLLVLPDEVERFLDWDATDEFVFVPELYDCDNFEFRLWGQINSLPEWAGLSIGIIWFSEPTHAMNIFVDIDGNV
jgi:virulence-associated protein VagC